MNPPMFGCHRWGRRQLGLRSANSLVQETPAEYIQTKQARHKIGRFGALKMEVAAVAYSVAHSPFYGHFMAFEWEMIYGNMTI